MAPTSPETARDEQDRSYRLTRSHRLKRKRLIDPLFDRKSLSTQSVSSGSIRLLFRAVEQADLSGASPVQAGFAVSRSLGSAVKRNRLKRMMREAFRHELEILSSKLRSHNSYVTMMMIVRRIPADDFSIQNDAARSIKKMLEVLLGQVSDRNGKWNSDENLT